MARVGLTITNPGAESASGSAPGWTSASNVLTTITSVGGAGARSFATQNAGAFDHFQDIAVPSGEFAAVDAGNRAAHLNALVGRLSVNMLTTSMTLYMRAINGTGTVLQSWTRRVDTLLGLVNTAFWENLPALTRTIRIGWSGTAGGALDVYVDDILLALDDPKAPAAFSRQASIVIDHTQCGASDTTNFEMRVAGNYLQLLPDLQGGAVVSSLALGTDTDHRGADIRFWADAACTTPLDYEISDLLWTNFGGGSNYVVHFEAWVRIPTLSHTVDTIIYMTVGNKTQVELTDNGWNSFWRAAHRFVGHFGGVAGGGGFNSTFQGPTGRDSSTFGNHLGQFGLQDGSAWRGTLTTFAMDSCGGAIVVSPSTGIGNDPVTHSDSTSLRLGTTFTIKAWAYPLSRANFRTILCKGSNTVRNYDIHMDSAGLITFAFSVAGTFMTLTTLAPIPLNTWTWIVCTYVAGSLRIWINNVLVATGPGASAPDVSTDPLEIGCLTSSRNFAWDGRIDEVRILDIIESADRLTAEYNNQKPGQTFYTISFGSSGGSAKSYLVG